MEKKEIKPESLERKIRRHEISFSEIQGENGPEYLDNYLHVNSASDFETIEDIFSKKQNRRFLVRNILKLSKEDRAILEDYAYGDKQVDMAKKHGKSPSAIKQNLDTVLYNFRVLLCNDEEFKQTESFDRLQTVTEESFVKYMKEVKNTGSLIINLVQVQDFIQELRKAIRQTVKTKADVNIREKLSKEINFSHLTDEYIEKMNAQFAELGIEADFNKLKKFKGNVSDVLTMVDDFINDLLNKKEEN